MYVPCIETCVIALLDHSRQLAMLPVLLPRSLVFSLVDYWSGHSLAGLTASGGHAVYVASNIT